VRAIQMPASAMRATRMAWEGIKGNYGDDPMVVDEARYRLANCVLSVASEESRNAAALTRGALEAMSRDYGDRSALGAPFSNAD
jgi:hypothetical protein